MKMDAAEAATNAALGLLVSWAVTYYALPMWGLTPSPMASVQITALYFVISFVRAWAIRWSFRVWLS
jgi:hypothetical protein